MIKAIIFDLDGTIVDTLQDLTNAVNNGMHARGFEETFTKEEVRQMIGSGTRVLCKRALAKHQVTDEEIEEVYKEFTKAYKQGQLDNTVAYPGVNNGLLALKREGYKIAVLSNKVEENTKTIVEHIFGNDVFDIVVGQRKNVPLKPDPTSVLNLINELGVDKTEVLYVGDSDTDMKTANNAGLTKVAVTWGFRSIDVLMPYKPDYIANEFNDILYIVKNK